MVGLVETREKRGWDAHTLIYWAEGDVLAKKAVLTEEQKSRDRVAEEENNSTIDRATAYAKQSATDECVCIVK